MLSVVVPLKSKPMNLEDSISEFIHQDFPASALQVIFVAKNKKFFEGTDAAAVPFDCRFLEFPKNDLAQMKNLGLSQANGDLILFVEPNYFFTKSTHLLELYELFLDRPELDVANIGQIRHFVHYDKELDQSHVLRSEAERGGESHFCIRSRCVQKGFWFGGHIFASNPLEELRAMGFAVQDHFPLSIHRQIPQNLIQRWTIGVMRSALVRWDRIVKSPGISRLQPILVLVHRGVGRSVQIGLSLTRVLGPGILFWIKWGISFLQTHLIPWFQLGYAALISFLRGLAVGKQIPGRIEKVVHPASNSRNIFVPHLESDDQNESTVISNSTDPQPPKFPLR